MSPSLAELTSAAEQLRHTEVADLALRAATIGDQLEDVLWNPAELVEVSTAIAQQAQQLGCTNLIGASEMGARLAAAAVAVSNNGLTGPTASLEGKRVCLVDSIVSTGWNVRRTKAEMLEKGAESVEVVAVLRGILSDSDDLDAIFLYGG